MADFDPQAWLELGRANRDQLPDGVVLPEPQIDYERYRAVLRRFYDVANKGATPAEVGFDLIDTATIKGLLAVADEVIALRDAPKDDGWIDWHGGERPVPPSAEVEVRLRGYPIDPERPNAGAAAAYTWQHAEYLADYDIVAYRIVQED